MTRSVSKEYAKSILSLLARHDLKQDDLHKAQLPVCPTWNQPSQLNVNWKGAEYLICSQDCGFIAGSWDFAPLSRGVPLGRHIRRCEKCKDGIIQIVKAKGTLIGKCSNARNKNGNSCDYTEEIGSSELKNYDPYPSPPVPDPDSLNSIIKNQTTEELENRGDICVAELNPREPRAQNISKKQNASKKVTSNKPSSAPKKTKKTRLSRAKKPKTFDELDSLLSTL